MAALRSAKNVELLLPMPCLVHPVKDLPAIGMGQFNFPLWNAFSYTLTNTALISKALIGYGNAVIEEWGWAPLKKNEVKHFLLEDVPVQYPISEALFPRPAYWPSHVRITGFRERNKVQHWIPPQELTAFLKTHPKPLYIGFGSMINAQPKAVGKAIVELSQELNLAILINTSWGGIELEDELPEQVFVVNDIPYDWLFERVCAVVHHGGSGTTHSALRYNKPQLILPHIADQFLWNKLIHKAGIGPLGFPIKKFSKERLETKIKELLRY
jgi:sterol 3beta-glucosyltransferase